MNREEVYEQLKIDEEWFMKSTTITSDTLPLESVILSKKVTRNSENLLELQLTKKESGRVLRETLTLPNECEHLYGEREFGSFPEQVQQILVNMMFNMGRPRLSQFKKMNKAIHEGDWKTAAVEGRDSRWHKQVTNRAERLMVRLEEV